MRRAHKLLSLLLVLTLALSISAPVGAAYSDTRGHWAEDAIDRWSAYGIVSGDGNGFNPDGNLTRGQMAKVLAETLGLTKQAEGNPFADVSADAWYAPYVLRCYEAGIMQGDGVNANPDATITREEAIVMLCRALGIAPASEGALASFTDSGNVASWAAPYVAAMVQSGIVSGVGNNSLAPTGNISRAALMTIMDRSIVQYINEPGSYELTDKAGIVLVAAGDVTLTGETRADVLVSPAAEGKAVAFDGAAVTGSVTVQAEDAKVTSENSTLPSVSFTGEGGGKVETVKPTEPAKPSTGGGSSGGGGSGSSHTHSWDEGTVTTAATCTEAGVKTFTCSCGQTKTEAIPALGHTPAEEYAAPDETGHWHVCTVCGEPADKTAHTYPEGTNCANPATCTVEGCGYTKAGGTHSWGEGVVTKAATCTEAGAMTYTCTLDDGGEKTETIPALGHAYAADFTVDTEATCTAVGSKSKHCSRCDSKTDVTAIEALGHDFSGAYLSDETNHWQKCSRCETEGTKTAHTWNDGVVSGETITFTCTVCSKTKTESVPTEKQVAVPTNYKLVLDLERRAANALSLEMTKPSDEDRELIELLLTYEFEINGTKSTTNMSKEVASTPFLSTYSNLVAGTNTIKLNITSKPTDAAKEEGYVEGTTSFTATITLTEGVALDTTGVSAVLDGTTLTISGLEANKIYEVRSSDGRTVTRYVYTDSDGKAIKTNVTGTVDTLSLWKLEFSDVTDTSASLTRCAASDAVAVTIKTTE